MIIFTCSGVSMVILKHTRYNTFSCRKLRLYFAHWEPNIANSLWLRSSWGKTFTIPTPMALSKLSLCWILERVITRENLNTSLWLMKIQKLPIFPRWRCRKCWILVSLNFIVIFTVTFKAYWIGWWPCRSADIFDRVSMGLQYNILLSILTIAYYVLRLDYFLCSPLKIHVNSLNHTCWYRSPG